VCEGNLPTIILLVRESDLLMVIDHEWGVLRHASNGTLHTSHDFESKQTFCKDVETKSVLSEPTYILVSTNS
jgi:hypothetical protein